MEGLQSLLDLDRAESAFRLLFSFLRDDSAAEKSRFEAVIGDILRGVRIPPGAAAKLERIYDAVHSSPLDLNSAIAAVARDFGSQREVLLALVSMLLRLISDEGMISRRHCSDLRLLLNSFNFSAAEYETFDQHERQLLSYALGGDSFSGWGSAGQSLAKYYEILGCEPSVTDGELRRAYRNLAMQYHPDRLAAQALGEKSRRTHERRFQAIQSAYETLVRVRSAEK